MSLYAKPGKLLAKQILWDIGTVVWVALWALVAIAVYRLATPMVGPFAKLSDIARQMASSMSDAAKSVADVPLVGDTLRTPFDTMAASFSSMTDMTVSAQDAINTLMLIVAIIVFVVPVAVWLWKWLTARINFIYQSSHSARLLASDGAVELFALRAIATAPLSQLQRITSNPMYAWHTGDQQVMWALAQVELKHLGLALPSRSRPPRQPATW